MKWRNLVFLVLCLTSFFAVEQGFYVPGVAPVEFKIGQRIDVKVSKKLRIWSSFSVKVDILNFRR